MTTTLSVVAATTTSRTACSMIFLQRHLPYHHIAIQRLGRIARLIAYIVRYLVGMMMMMSIVVVVVVGQWYGCTNDNVCRQIDGIVVGHIDCCYTLLLLLLLMLMLALVVALVVVIRIGIGAQCIGVVPNNVANLRRIIPRGRYQWISTTTTSITNSIHNKRYMSRHIPHHILAMFLQDRFAHIHTPRATTIPLDVAPVVG
mmetsp:Transcript_16068/g.25047  ORF Transcript_16068/g.25047 Transcript_16068/m.25047 type:complete len:201 (+) Transcript_16068:879-1481(+)